MYIIMKSTSGYADACTVHTCTCTVYLLKKIHVNVHVNQLALQVHAWPPYTHNYDKNYYNT